MLGFPSRCQAQAAWVPRPLPSPARMPTPGPWQGRRERVGAGGRGLRGSSEAGCQPSHPPEAPRGGRPRREPGPGWASGEQGHKPPHCKEHVEMGLGQRAGAATQPRAGTGLNGRTGSCGQSCAARHPALKAELEGRPLSPPRGPGLARLVQGFQAWGPLFLVHSGPDGWAAAEGNRNPLQYPCLGVPGTEEPGGLHAVHGSQKGQKRLSN